MITPRFSVRQDETSVYVEIHAPHVRAQTIEFDVEDDQFKFFANPYYLRLTFPGKVVEDEKSTASLDAASGNITVALSKQNPGEEFANLDLLTSLLATRREKEAESSQSKRPFIEEVGNIDSTLQEAYLDEEFDWELPQQLNNDSLLKEMYGFNQQYSGYLTHVHSTANEINEVENPENDTAEKRRQTRIACEDAKFDEDYYMENYINDEFIQMLIQQKSRFCTALQQQQANEQSAVVDQLAAQVDQLLSTGDPKSSTELKGAVEFTDDEKKIMLDLPRKTHIIQNKQSVYLGLVDILFAYLLDQRINQDEFTVESTWAIGAVSATLSNLEQFTSLRSTVVACFRRGLAYPLYRNWELCEKVLEDICNVCQLGRRAILKVFLQIKGLFDQHDIYYIYSKLYIDDYCVWLQTTASDKIIGSLAHKLHRLEVEKDEIGWELDAYEDLALMTSESDMEETGRPNAEDLAVNSEQSLGLEIAQDDSSREPMIEVLDKPNASQNATESCQNGVDSRSSANVDLSVPAQAPVSDLLALEDKSAEAQSKIKKPLIEIID
ncbi:hypothetical protein LPJ78_005575 [Coemansia sp. RSA 989]|nr:SHQ1 protein-domain-containing protein [Coemansia mojavensis]KAJ1738554.1 hypothetical protein LPJ68_005451 [Coemansia sp. RSA 1086]KAJ1861020.1 hypothetical protein LPJ78_005575 [Coemansia sp. RSA 989]KAJ2669016.1 hypothetical protein IWW42_004856 [Coemansia sp. RSA 1085]